MRAELQPVLIAARTIATEELPHLLGELEEVRATALARLTVPATHQQSPDVLLGVDEAAKRLGVSKDYLYRNHRRLPFVRRMGRSLLFSEHGIDLYIRRPSVLTHRRHPANMAPVS